MEGFILPVIGIIALIVLWKILTKVLRFVLTAVVVSGIIYVVLTYAS
ncbi:MAG: hypothetical protein AAGF95_30135 [Chloroflexota bacterium]